LAARGRAFFGHRAGDRRGALFHDASARSSAAGGDARKQGAAERRPPRRTRKIRFRLRCLSLQKAGATILAALLGTLSRASGRFSSRAHGEGASGLAAIRLCPRSRRGAAAVGLVLSRRAVSRATRRRSPARANERTQQFSSSLVPF